MCKCPGAHAPNLFFFFKCDKNAPENTEENHNEMKEKGYWPLLTKPYEHVNNYNQTIGDILETCQNNTIS